MGFMADIFLTVTAWFAGIIYIIPVKHKDNFKLRVLASLIFSIAAGIILYFFKNAGIHKELEIAFVYYIMLILIISTCAEISAFATLYCAVWALLTQQIIYELWVVFSSFAIENNILRTDFRIITGILFYAVIYTIFEFTIIRWLPEKGQYNIGPKQLISGIMFLIVFELLLSLLYSGSTLVFSNRGWAVIMLVQFQCITMLYLQNELFKKSAMRNELLTLNMLWHQQKQQYSLAKENIILINRKCHDLKHQIRAIRDMASQEDREKYLDEIEDSIRIYEAIVRTGNELLDTILTEKSLYCKEKQIYIHCVADGSLLNFMNSVDLYTIFGNAIDNAIEGVEKFRDIDRRQIDVLIYKQKEFLVINIINPIADNPDFEDGLPVTTKGDKGYHGFGLKSIRHIVHKYDGFLSVGIEDGCFSLKILLSV